MTLVWNLLPVKSRPTTRHYGFQFGDRKSTRLNSSHLVISYAVFCLKKKIRHHPRPEPHHLEAGAARRGDIKGTMHRRPPAPQIVVVHAGEVVVHERIGVHHLDRGTQLGDGAVAAPQRLVGGEHERGSQALTLAEQRVADGGGDRRVEQRRRSEEHTSELQSPCNLVCRLLLEKKKNR